MSVQVVSVEEIADVKLGRQRSPKNHDGPNMRRYLRAANVGWSGLLLDDVKAMNFTDAEMAQFRLEPGDILLNEASGSPREVGKPAIWQGEIDECAFQNTLLRVRPQSDVDPRYLLHFFRHEAESGAFVRGARGTGINHLGRAALAKWKVPLSPIEEQRRIAAILDHADALRAKRREALARLDELTQSIFIDMFGDPVSNPSGYPVRTLGEIAEFYAGGTLPEGEDFAGQTDGFALLKVSDLNLPGNERVLRSSQGWSAHPGARSATCPAGSVVIPKRGGAIGTNKKRLTSRPSILDPNLMAIKPQQSQLGLEFLYAWFERLDLNSLISGSSVPQLNKKDLAPLVIPVPPYELQLEFAARANVIGHIRSGHRANLVELDALFASLQSRAFRGEL
ncbi:restriction endonuclease subunit S [Nocardia brevicatena]|uniref:restriction endonuclease subunit S n=1 Tax=Nocardia brevicatena TaxID=37327 RepID=UPI0002F8BBDD|nr:restriction endonuclease subunit S [Nocardia brevicatena]